MKRTERDEVNTGNDVNKDNSEKNNGNVLNVFYLMLRNVYRMLALKLIVIDTVFTSKYLCSMIFLPSIMSFSLFCSRTLSMRPIFECAFLVNTGQPTH